MPDPSDFVRVVLIRDVTFPCGHRYRQRGGDPGLKYGTYGFVCPECGREVSHMGLKVREWTEVVEEPSDS